MKYTPGKWYAVTTDHYQTIRSDEHVIADMRFSGGSVINPHNADLIAAAPDLLQTLIHLREELHAAFRLNVKKHYSLMVADAAAETAIHRVTGGERATCLKP